jgi:molecular chaperone HtpG
MVSDEVEIITCSVDDEKARKISLRSVHGRYLVRLLDKGRDAEAMALAPHGTQVRLKIRSTANLGSVLDIMRQWVVIPRCQVSVSIDGGAPVAIGFKSAADAIQRYLEEVGVSIDGEAPQYKIVAREADGVEFAYAAKWSSHYRDWSIAYVLSAARPGPIPCTCVEGIAVVFSTPGMNDRMLIAIANATGPNAPKTNVARSTLEATPERNALYSTIYGLYVDHVKDEIARLSHQERYSLTWAANNAITLVPFGLSGRADSQVALPNELRDRMKTLPIYIVEKGGKRKNIDFNTLLDEEIFWTVDCNLVSSAEELVKEVKSNSSVSDIVAALGDPAQALPEGTVLYNLDVNSGLRSAVELEFEPYEITGSESLRRIDIKWGRRTSGRWVRIGEIVARKYRQISRRGGQITDYLGRRLAGVNEPGERRTHIDISEIQLASTEVPFHGLQEYSGTTSLYRTFLRGDLPITAFLRNLALRADDEAALLQLEVFATVFMATGPLAREDAVNRAATQLRHIGTDLGEELTRGSDEFLEALRSSPLQSFNTSVWLARQFHPTFVP